MDRYRVIAKFAKENNWKQGLELGVWVGVTTFHMMRKTDVKMYCVDSWDQTIQSMTGSLTRNLDGKTAS